MEFKKYTLLGKDGRYYGNDRWHRFEDMLPKYLYDTIKEAREQISWAYSYAESYSSLQESAIRFLDNKPVIEEVIVNIDFVEHDMTQIPINGGYL